MTWVSVVFEDVKEIEIEDIENEYIDEFVIIKTSVKKNVWKIFRTIAHMKKISTKEALDDALTYWIGNNIE
jgi:hypothetical protein